MRLKFEIPQIHCRRTTIELSPDEIYAGIIALAGKKPENFDVEESKNPIYVGFSEVKNQVKRGVTWEAKLPNNIVEVSDDTEVITIFTLLLEKDNGDTYDKLRQNPPVIDLPDFDWSTFIEKLKEIIPDITTNPTLPNIGKALASIGKVLIKQMKKDDLLGIVTDIYHTKDFDFSRQHDYKGQLCKYKVQNKVSKV